MKKYLNLMSCKTKLKCIGVKCNCNCKANIFNMGVEGQLLLGGFFSGIVGASMDLNSPLLQKLICILVGMVCGACFNCWVSI